MSQKGSSSLFLALVRKGSCSLFFALLMWGSAAWACPGCKESLFDPGGLPQRLGLAKGYALSIGLMLAVPAGLVGGVTALIIRAQRRRREAQGRIDTPTLSR